MNLTSLRNNKKILISFVNHDSQAWWNGRGIVASRFSMSNIIGLEIPSYGILTVLVGCYTGGKVLGLNFENTKFENISALRSHNQRCYE